MSVTGDPTTEPTTTERGQGWLDGPVSRGLALVLLTANIAVMGWMFQRQGETLEHMEAVVGFSTSSVPSVSTNDPELCWMVGSLARAQGKGDEMLRLLSNSPDATECAMGAQRGASGLRPDGS
jgi:hypothetical protein